MAIGACVITALPMLRRAPLVAIEGGLIEVLDLDEVFGLLSGDTGCLQQMWRRERFATCTVLQLIGSAAVDLEREL